MNSKKALVIHDSVEIRGRLCRMLSAVGNLEAVETLSQVEDAHPLLNEGRAFDLIFLSGDFEPGELANIVEQVKKSRHSHDCVMVLVLGPEQQDPRSIANHLAVGFHGFLNQPFSLSSMEEVMTIAAAVRLQNSGTRLRAATGLMLTQEMEQTQRLGGSLWDRVEGACERYKEVTGESVTVSIVQEMKELSPSKRVPSYEGVSKRVRGLLERKFKEQMLKLQAKK